MSEPDSTEVLRKIGRNVVNFQKLEGMLRYLASTPNYNGSLSQLRKQREKHVSSLRKKSFGLVVRDFFETVYPEELSNSDVSDPNSGELSIKIDGEGRARLVTAIETVVDARNDLIHHRLIAFDPSSTRSCKELIAYLDDQNEQLIPVYEEIAVLTESMRLARKEMVRLFDSELEQSNDDNSADA